MSATMREWALWYRSQNLSVIPVSGKVPLIKWAEFQGRIASEEEIKGWWEKWPEADIGCVTGPITQRLVLDIDGERGFSALKGNDLPLTPTVRTWRGIQYHFQLPKFNGKHTLAGLYPEVDTRGAGGYVKLPPSRCSGNPRRYEWVNDLSTPLAECPDWLLKLLEEKNKPRQIDRENGESWFKEKLDSIAPDSHNRNATFASIAGRLRNNGWNSEDIYSLLAPHAKSVDFADDELQRTCQSIGSYPANKSMGQAQEAQSISDFLADEQKVEWIVPGLIAKRSISFIHGQPQTAKSWMAFDLAITCAKGGGHWLGKFPTNGAKVLLIEAERFRGETQRRIKGLLNGQGLAVQSVSDAMCVKTGSTTRLNLPQSFDALKRLLADEKPALVIWDSFATAHTVGETDRMSIQAVLENIKALRDEFGCAFFWVNHDTKQSLVSEPGTSKQPSMNDMQGNTAVAAAAEMMLGVRRKDKDSCMVYNTKNTLANTIEPFEVIVRDIDQEKTKIRVEGK